MTGLNLETFLQLLRVDAGIWASLGLVALILALLTWTSWGSRRALRKCLILSIAAHVGLVVFGGNSPIVRQIFRLGTRAPRPEDPARRVRVMPWVEEDRSPRGKASVAGRPARKVATWDQDRTPLAMAEPDRAAGRREPTQREATPRPEAPAPLAPMAPESVAPELKAPAPPPVEALAPVAPKGPDAPLPVASADPDEVAPAPSVAAPAVSEPGFPAEADLRSRSRGVQAAPSRRPDASNPSAREPVALPTPTPTLAPASPTPDPATARDLIPPDRPARVASPATEPPAVDDAPDRGPTAPGPAASSDAGMDLPDADIRSRARPSRGGPVAVPVAPPRRLGEPSAPVDLARATPAGPANLPSSPGPIGRRPMAEVPPVYRSRLDPNRTALAQRAGASLASEQAVERALAWLARHQDADGRWDGGTARGRDGAAMASDDSFTIHCPPGDTCFGECYYPEADTALTGLSLLAYLGAGYTHVEGKYAPVVAKGIDFLRRSQKADGDLRGESTAVGMYCHSMATLALSEAYALTGDARLRLPVEKAVGFLVRARSSGGMAWRYQPGAADSDTSILGWAVMALKSAKVVGIPIPPPTLAGISAWLGKVATGRDGGLARYLPGKPESPTMTAEAWACRQFLELGGPGRASDEAAAYLLRNESEGGEFNVYYLYYGTLAMYQHGGEAWSTWNARVRDQVVRRQQVKGHKAGSWDPDDSQYGTYGGRIYGTALATLTLEVYYRFLRLYEPTPAAAPPPSLAPRPDDAGTRRAGFRPAPPGR